MLCQPVSSGERAMRCNHCKRFRAHLRVKRSRRSNSDLSSAVADDSHTNYSDLTKDELIDRLKNVQKSRKAIRSRCAKLARELIKKDGVKVTDDDESDIQALIDKVAPDVEEKYGEDSPQSIFWHEQRKYNSLKNKRQMRWHPLVVRFALYSSRVAYRTATSSGFLVLPSERLHSLVLC